MSIIICTCNCIYQDNGCCGLERTASADKTVSAPEDSCAYFVKKQKFINNTIETRITHL